jgi:hypothetical protein
VNAVIVIPWRPGDPVRERNYKRVREFWDETGLPVFTADSGHEFFTAGISRNQAAAEAGDWDVAVFSDADVLPGSTEQIADAVATANETGAFTVGYSEFRWLSEEATRALCEDGVPADRVRPERAIKGTWINTFAIRRDLFELAGRFDEGFVGYGMEDLAFYKAAATLGGTQRVSGVLCHLHHDRRPDEERIYSNWNREVRYNKAFGDRERMLAVIAERT